MRGTIGLGVAVCVALCAATPSTAHAERVLVLRPDPAIGSGRQADADLLARAEGATIAALVSMSHEPIRDESSAPATDLEITTRGADRGAAFVVRIRPTPTQAGYVAHVTVFDVRTGTSREASGEIVPLREVGQLVALMTPLMVTEAGGSEPATAADPGADADTGADSDADTDSDADPEADSDPDETGGGGVSEAQGAWGERERERQETAQREAWENRERYGVPKPILIQGGLSMRPILNGPDALGSSVLGAVELRFGYGLPSTPGLEFRGSLEGVFGAVSGFSLMGGAVYLFSPFIDAPVHFGPSLEIGWLQGFADGFTQAFFAIRAAHVVSWRFGGDWYLEGAIPELGVLAANGAAVTLGLSARVGHRF